MHVVSLDINQLESLCGVLSSKKESLERDYVSTQTKLHVQSKEIENSFACLKGEVHQLQMAKDQQMEKVLAHIRRRGGSHLETSIQFSLSFILLLLLLLSLTGGFRVFALFEVPIDRKRATSYLDASTHYLHYAQADST